MYEVWQTIAVQPGNLIFRAIHSKKPLALLAVIFNHTYTSLTMYSSHTWNTGRYCSFLFFLLLYSMIYIHEYCPCFWYLNMHLPIILTTDKEKRKCTQESSLSSQCQKKEYHKFQWDIQCCILFKICFQRTETLWPVITWPRLKFLAVPSRKYYSYFYYADLLLIDLLLLKLFCKATQKSHGGTTQKNCTQQNSYKLLKHEKCYPK